MTLRAPPEQIHTWGGRCMVKLRKGPVCQGTLSDGSPCEARVEHPGERCHVCLERLASSADVVVRRLLAQRPGLPAAIFELLGDDPDDQVRLELARRADCPLVVLQHLEHDDHPEVRAAAAAAVSTAFTPRVLNEPGRSHLFTRAELDAFGQADVAADDDPFGPPALARASTGAAAAPQAHPGPPPAAGPAPSPTAAGPRRAAAGEPKHMRRSADRIQRPGATAVESPSALFSGIDEILSRLDRLSDRLSSLEAVLASTGDRLGVMSDRLDDLGEPGAHARRAAPAAGPGTGVSLLPVVHPAELGTGPVIRTDIVAAAWLAMLPLLVRARTRGPRPAPAVAADRVVGPFMEARVIAVAALPRGDAVASDDPSSAETTAAGALRSADARRAARAEHRRHAVHARRRGSPR